MTASISLPPNGGDPGTWGPVLNAAIQAVSDDSNAHQAAADPHGDRAYADTNKVAKSANLSDLASASTARTNLGLGDVATHSAAEFATPASVAAAIAAAISQTTLVNL